MSTNILDFIQYIFTYSLCGKIFIEYNPTKVIFMFDIGSRIIALRNLHNISANKLSKEINVDPSTINKIEKGTAKPSIDLLFKICSYFNVTLAEFFDNKTTELPPDLLQLLETAKKLTPEERKKFTDLLQTILERTGNQ
jgi:transcriptional regulator with XRE-family HTH domain